jgi:hypothetical protein
VVNKWLTLSKASLSDDEPKNLDRLEQHASSAAWTRQCRLKHATPAAAERQTTKTATGD